MLQTLFAKIRRWHMKTLKPFGKSTSDLRCSFGDTNYDVAQALAAAFHNVDAVEVVYGNLLDLHCDAILSPANSFGDMGGGIDKAIDDFHRGQPQERLVAAIADHYLGELPVGAALVVELSAKRFPFLVAAPTMRIPGNIQGSINAYLSLRGALVAVMRHNANTDANRTIRSIAIPGLGTGVGGLEFDEAAKQMRAAYDNIIAGHWQRVFHAAQAPFAFKNRIP